MRISEFLRRDFILPSIAARDVAGVIREVASRAAEVGVGAGDVVAEKLLDRERSHSTVMGSGMAVPHATVPGLPKPVIGIAIAREPIQFGPEGLEPVQVFFVLLSPPGHEREHVKLLARLCRLGRHENFLERLTEVATEDEIARVVTSIDAQHV